MIVLGFDPGTARCGWGVVEDSAARPVCLGYGVIETGQELRAAQRLAAVAAGAEALIARYSPGLVGVEKLFFSRNVTTAIPVAQARGVLLLCSERAGVPILEFTPQEVKLALTGNGRADKPQMQKMVQLLLCLPQLPKPDDAADAVAVALTAARSRSSPLASARRG